MFIYWPCPVFLPSTMTATHKLSRYWADTVVAFNATVTLTFDLLTSKCIGVIYWVWPSFLPSTMTVTYEIFKTLSGNSFGINIKLWPWPLTYWPQTLFGVIYWPLQIFLQSTINVTHKLFKILSRHEFCIKCYCDLDLWPSDLKVYRGHLLTMTNLPTNYHDCHP